MVPYPKITPMVQEFRMTKDVIRAAHNYPSDSQLRENAMFGDEWADYKDRMTRNLYQAPRKPVGVIVRAFGNDTDYA